jgi:signal peptidase II
MSESESQPHVERKWLVFAIVAILSIVADQATKVWARHDLPVYGHGSDNGTCVVPEDLGVVPALCAGKTEDVISGFWQWRLSMNHGSAFGLFANSPGAARILLSIVGIGAVIGMFMMMRKARKDQKILHWGLALVAGGAIGNLIDRTYFGYVTDFVLWHYQTHEWPVFNVADVVLVIGVVLLFMDSSREGKRDKRRKADALAKARQAGLIKDLRE